MPDTVGGSGLLDHELTKKLTNLFQEYQPSVIVPALSQQSVEDLALFFLILTLRIFLIPWLKLKLISLPASLMIRTSYVSLKLLEKYSKFFPKAFKQ